MNRFRFRFRSVLRYREIIEDNKKRDFGVALNHFVHEEANLNSIDNSIAGHEELAERSGQGRITARDLQNKYDYARHLDRKRESQEKVVESAEEELESRRKKLVEATKEKKIFERLKERDRETHNEAQRKEEQALSDDLTSQRFKITPNSKSV
jgi:flagellar FliJ protein